MTDPEANYQTMTKRELFALAIYPDILKECKDSNEPSRQAAVNTAVAVDMLIEELNGGKP